MPDPSNRSNRRAWSVAEGEETTDLVSVSVRLVDGHRVVVGQTGQKLTAIGQKPQSSPAWTPQFPPSTLQLVNTNEVSLVAQSRKEASLRRYQGGKVEGKRRASEECPRLDYITAIGHIETHSILTIGNEHTPVFLVKPSPEVSLFQSPVPQALVPGNVRGDRLSRAGHFLHPLPHSNSDINQPDGQSLIKALDEWIVSTTRPQDASNGLLKPSSIPHQALGQKYTRPQWSRNKKNTPITPDFPIDSERDSLNLREGSIDFDSCTTSVLSQSTEVETSPESDAVSTARRVSTNDEVSTPGTSSYGKPIYYGCNGEFRIPRKSVAQPAGSGRMPAIHQSNNPFCTDTWDQNMSSQEPIDVVPPLVIANLVQAGGETMVRREDSTRPGRSATRHERSKDERSTTTDTASRPAKIPNRQNHSVRVIGTNDHPDPLGSNPGRCDPASSKQLNEVSVSHRQAPRTYTRDFGDLFSPVPSMTSSVQRAQIPNDHESCDVAGDPNGSQAVDHLAKKSSCSKPVHRSVSHRHAPHHNSPYQSHKRRSTLPSSTSSQQIIPYLESQPKYYTTCVDRPMVTALIQRPAPPEQIQAREMPTFTEKLSIETASATRIIKRELKEKVNMLAKKF